VVPVDAVWQLLGAGHSRLRVVVVQQPDGMPLLDDTWQLPEAHSYHSRAAGAPPPAGELQTTGGRDSTELPAMPLAAGGAEGVLVGAEGDMRLLLALPVETAGFAGFQRGLPGAAGAGVLSVLVMADSNTDSGIVTTAAGTTTPSAASPGADGTSRTVEPFPTAPDAAPAGAAHKRPGLVIAHLPLLVLPAAAQQEMLGVFAALMEAGSGRCGAYQQLLPLLQDWAAFMTWAPDTTAPA